MDSPSPFYIGRPLDLRQHDCACPEPLVDSIPFPAIDADAEWCVAPDIWRMPLEDGYEVILGTHASPNIFVLHPDASSVLDCWSRHGTYAITDDSSTWQHNLFTEFCESGLLARADSLPSQPQHQSSILTAWLHVTNDCNLRCDYCYVTKTPHTMDASTGQRAVETIVQMALNHGFREIKLKYAGGEALLNFRRIVDLHEIAKSLTSQSGLALHAEILTNGVALTRDMLRRLRDANIALSISLDGVGEAHDAQRRFSNGRGSFTHVERAIDRALSEGVMPFLSITVTGRNADALPQAVAFALDRGLRFNLNFFRDNECTGGIADLQADQERLIAGMRAAFAVIEERMPDYRLIDSLIDRSAFHAGHQHACGAGHSYMVVDHHGAIARCQMEIERPVTSVYAADPLAEIRLHADGFQNLPAVEKEGCRDCTWRNWCAGGCSLLTYRMTGRNDVKSPYCIVYKALFPEMLRLEGLRLLKWGSDIPL